MLILGKLCGNEQAAVAHIFRGVVVEFVAGDYLAYAGRHRLVISYYGTLNLKAVHKFFENRFSVARERLFESLPQLAFVVSLCDAYGGACVGRFYEYRIAECCFGFFYEFGTVFAVFVYVGREPFCLSYSGLVGKRVCDRLIHAHRRRKNAAADIRYTGQLQKPLYCAVLAVFAVHYGKADVNMYLFWTGLPENRDAVVFSVGREQSLCAFAAFYPFILRQKRNVALKEKPFALLGYTERANLVFIARNVAYNV